MAEQLPYTDEDERIASAMVDEALASFRKLLSDARLDEVREQMVDELLATENGRAKIRTARAYAMAKSEEVAVGAAGDVAPVKKEGSGG